jgi:hypothetical protein
MQSTLLKEKAREIQEGTQRKWGSIWEREMLVYGLWQSSKSGQHVLSVYIERIQWPYSQVKRSNDLRRAFKRLMKRRRQKERWTSICCWSRGVNIKSNNHIGFVRIVYKWAYTHWRRKSVAGQSTLIIWLPIHINMLCVVWSIQPNVLNWIRPIVNWIVIQLITQKWGEDMLVVCRSHLKLNRHDPVPWENESKKLCELLYKKIGN